MAGGGKVRIADRDNTGEMARVVNGRLLVSGSGGGAATDVNIDQVGGNPVGTTVPVSDGGGSLTVDGAVTIQEPLSVDDNGGSLTVDGTVDVGNFPAVQPVNDNGGSLTVDDGGVPISVDDNGGSLTVDGSVAVSNFPAVQPVSDNGGSLTVDGAVTVSGTVSVSNGFTPSQLNQSVAGEPIAVTTVAPVNVHNPGGAELITIFASNLTTVDATIIVNFGGAVAPANDLYFFVPSEETVPLVVQAYLDNGSIDIRRAAGAGQINIFGRVDVL